MSYYKLNIELTEDDVSWTKWDDLSRSASQASRALLSEVLRETRQLARAEAVCRTVPVTDTTDKEIIVAGGQVLNSKLLVSLAGPAKILVLIICTLGVEIDRRIEEYNRAGLSAHAYFLDMAGTCIIEAAGRQVVEQVKREIEAHSLETTIPLGPGHSYWNNLSDQKTIYNLLNPSNIGVSILDSGIMLPKKSLSMVMGIGSKLPPSAENHCHYCSLGSSCPISRTAKQI